MAAPIEMHDLPDDVQKLLKKHPSLELLKADNKIKCHYTGHEMKCSVASIESYINGRKYKKAAAIAAVDKYKPHIIPSSKKGRESQLFCTLTLRHINKEPGHLERHVNGRRYKKALARWKDCQEKGIEFKPRIGNKPKSVPGLESSKEIPNDESGEESQDDARDDMSDLYPDADFHQNSDSDGTEEDTTDDSDFEFEDLEPEVSSNSTNNQNSSLKRTTKDECESNVPKKKFQEKKSKSKLKSNPT